jgi:hypothetical protein
VAVDYREGDVRQLLPSRQCRPHHVGIILESVPAAVAGAAAAGYEVVENGSGIGPERDGSWAYIDTTADLGLMIEAVEPPSSMPAIEFVWPEDTP